MGPSTEASTGFYFVKGRIFIFKYIKITPKHFELLWVKFDAGTLDVLWNLRPSLCYDPGWGSNPQPTSVGIKLVLERLEDEEETATRSCWNYSNFLKFN